MEERQTIDLERNDKATNKFIAVVNDLGVNILKNIFNTPAKSTFDEIQERNQTVGDLNRFLKIADPNLPTPLVLADLKSIVLDTLNYIAQQTNNPETKAAFEKRMKDYDEDFSVDREKLAEQLKAVEPTASPAATTAAKPAEPMPPPPATPRLSTPPASPEPTAAAAPVPPASLVTPFTSISPDPAAAQKSTTAEPAKSPPPPIPSRAARAQKISADTSAASTPPSRPAPPEPVPLKTGPDISSAAVTKPSEKGEYNILALLGFSEEKLRKQNFKFLGPGTAEARTLDNKAVGEITAQRDGSMHTRPTSLDGAEKDIVPNLAAECIAMMQLHKIAKDAADPSKHPALPINIKLNQNNIKTPEQQEKADRINNAVKKIVEDFVKNSKDPDFKTMFHYDGKPIMEKTITAEKTPDLTVSTAPVHKK